MIGLVEHVVEIELAGLAEAEREPARTELKRGGEGREGGARGVVGCEGRGGGEGRPGGGGAGDVELARVDKVTVVRVAQAVDPQRLLEGNGETRVCADGGDEVELGAGEAGGADVEAEQVQRQGVRVGGAVGAEQRVREGERGRAGVVAKL